MALKRPLDVSFTDKSLDFLPSKCQKFDLDSDSQDSQSESPSSCPSSSDVPVTPESRKDSTIEDTPEKLLSFESVSNMCSSSTQMTLERAVSAAMKLYTEAFTKYCLEKDRKSEDKADELAEAWAAEHYEELKSAMLGLLPWAGAMKPATGGLYDRIEFQGCRTPQREICKRQLEHLRKKGDAACAWEALCALIAAVSSRKEKNWLEVFPFEDSLKELDKRPGCKSKSSARRQAAIRNEVVPKLIEEGAGHFAESLIDPKFLHAVILARGPSGPLPVASVTTRKMPLWDALKTMDDEGPLRAAAADKAWCWGKDVEFALQELDLAFCKDTQKKHGVGEMKHVKSLQPEKKLRDLLRSRRPVLLLDNLAALAPREVGKANGFSEIITAELAALFREAKARGEAVVFSVGSADPHKLASRVYLRPPLADYGMRCGCLRWRESSQVPWAREFRWDERIVLGLQLP